MINLSLGLSDFSIREGRVSSPRPSIGSEAEYRGDKGQLSGLFTVLPMYLKKVLQAVVHFSQHLAIIFTQIISICRVFRW